MKLDKAMIEDIIDSLDAYQRWEDNHDYRDQATIDALDKQKFYLTQLLWQIEEDEENASK